MYVINRQPTAERALASATRLSAKHGSGLFAVTEDRSPAGGGDQFPFVVFAASADYYDRKA